MPRNDVPAWADDLDSKEWQAIFADPRWQALVRTMAAEIAAEDAAERDTTDEAA